MDRRVWKCTLTVAVASDVIEDGVLVSDRRVDACYDDIELCCSHAIRLLYSHALLGIAARPLYGPISTLLSPPS